MWRMGRRVCKKDSSSLDMLHFRCLLDTSVEKSSCQGYESGAQNIVMAGVMYLDVIHIWMALKVIRLDYLSE